MEQAGTDRGLFLSIPGDDKSKPVACWIGLHAWHPMESEPGFPLIACLRCGKRETPSGSVASGLGWNQHVNG